MAPQDRKPAIDGPRNRERHPGLAVRLWAAGAVRRTVRERRSLDEALQLSAPKAALGDADRSLVRAIAMVTFRRFGTIRRVLAERLSQGEWPDAGLLREAVQTATAQILFLDIPDHAAVDVAIELCKQDPQARHFAKLANAVLRRVAAEKENILARPIEGEDSPAWLLERWRQAYGPPAALAIAAQHAQPPSIDLTLFAPEAAKALDGMVEPLQTGSWRLRSDRAVTSLPGFADGHFQVQDAASAMPARLFGDLRGKRVLDLCAAPGGKTAQLIHAGAIVTAVERSAQRAERLRENLDRLKMQADLRVMDAMAVADGPYDAVLLDAPCSATGTIRRHPEIAWTKTLADILALATQQTRLLAHAASLVRPGGLLVYATCSLEPEEGELQIARFLGSHEQFRAIPVDGQEFGLASEAINPDGFLRLLPSAMTGIGGVDGFFAARLRRLA
ncbi:RsmB/NOP family class I SAM-dependent RNA methyltransferase [Rhabdaerophilum sp. SD176]|uniref:RsmB/NOP family class I SAM-dependent RNA methyltransferase n=1 Tax=Rhabdaerophilum sp. SD176 TaxID=2983548 RepID=UPI0024DFF54B|nr:RsmB/NOP family class I SAM-dependent RNA methyltransferase [Rhabdaerophilum sp. SD176]